MAKLGNVLQINKASARSKALKEAIKRAARAGKGRVVAERREETTTTDGPLMRKSVKIRRRVI